MSASLISLAPELVCSIVQELPVKYARNLLESCKTIYWNGKYAFDEKCFHTLPVGLSQANLRKVDDILDNESCRFLRRIFIRLDHNILDLASPNQLTSVLAKGLRASTKCETIIIYDDPRTTSRIIRVMFTKVAEALERILLFEDIKPFKVQIRNIRLDNSQELAYYRKFLKLVESVDLRFDSKKTESFLVTLFGKTLSLATNLQSLSLIVNGDKLLSPKTVRRITKRIRCKTLKSLTINGISTSKGQLEGILRPFRASIKNVTLKSATFNNTSFAGFISHIQDNFSLDYIYFKDIWEHDNGKEYEVVDRVKFSRGGIPGGLNTLKSNIRSLVES
jgi:hypothetical protein